ncbi:MAG: TIR domain-containing protein, partial [Anaerolineae bacterium]|nr:TIR domain-containing protein [Anaerolineae bacterium]
MSRIFINYRRQDSEGYVGRLYDHLVQHFAREDVFMDVDNIDPGADFVHTLEQAVAACDVFIAVIGPQWLSVTDDSGQRRLDRWDDFVRIEVASALTQDKRVIPVLVGGARMPAPADLPDDLAALARRQAVELTHPRFLYDVARLIDAIRSALHHANRPTPAGDSAGNAAPEGAALSEKAAALRALRVELVDAADSPLYQFRTDNRLFPVLGGGSPDAKLFFIGESPGKYEAERGIPFVGPSGDVFEEMLGRIGLKRDDVFVTNIILDRPPEKRPPTPDEIVFYTPFVDRLIDIIRPAVIIPLGRWAAQHILKKYGLPEARQTIGQLHGTLLKAQADYGEIHIVPLY